MTDIAGRSTWINGRGWDLRWLIGSACVVPIVLVAIWAGVSERMLDLGVTALVGAPHLWSTYLATYADPRFRGSHRWILALATVLVPAFVITMTVVHFQLLLSVFIFAASVHVLQQNAYLTDVYRRRSAVAEPGWSRFIDYGTLGLSIYPIACYKLVHGSFQLGDVVILIPAFAKHDVTWQLVSLSFAVFVVAWLAKTVAEARRGVLNVPKTVLIATTTIIAFFVPMAAAGSRLALAFQSVNMWHSIQYLGIVWFILKVRKERGLIDNRFVASISGAGSARRFYGFCFLLSLALLALVACLVYIDPLRLKPEQYYYMSVLSALLIHYVLDGYFFAVSNRAAASFESIPFAAPATA